MPSGRGPREGQSMSTSPPPQEGGFRLLPPPLRPWAALARLDRPAGWVLLLLPGWWGLALAEVRAPGLYLLFLAGAILMRAAGCVVNDLADRQLDARVRRTAGRPLASGAVSVKGALVFLALLLAAAALVLFSLPREAVLLGAASLPLILAYPRMKRVTWWPQVFLGVVFNWGALLSWVAGGGSLYHPVPWLLWGGCFFWTLGYDTLYAAADLEDDAAVGIRSSARRLQGRLRSFVGGCFLAALGLWAAAVWVSPLARLADGPAGGALAMPPLLLSLAGLALMGRALLAQAAGLPRDRPPAPKAALAAFHAQARFGLLWSAALLLALLV